jgi:hypothetical protein
MASAHLRPVDHPRNRGPKLENLRELPSCYWGRNAINARQNHSLMQIRDPQSAGWLRHCAAALAAIGLLGCSVYDTTLPPNSDAAAGTGATAGEGGSGGAGQSGASGAGAFGGEAGTTSTGGTGGAPNRDASSEARESGAGDAADAPLDVAFGDVKDAVSGDASPDASDAAAQDHIEAAADLPTPPADASVDMQDVRLADREGGTSDSDGLPPLDVGGDPDTSGEAGPPTGVTYTLVAKHSAKCADVYHNETADGTILTQYTCNATSAQSFELRSANGAYTFVGSGSGKCLATSNGGTADGTPIVIGTCNGSAGQAFTLRATGSGHYAIVHVASDKCIDVRNASTANGAALQLFGCSGQDHQAWAFQ